MSFQRHTFTPSDVERLLHYMPTVASKAGNDWSTAFAKSITRQSHRRGWTPSPKQLSIMRGLVSDLFAYGLTDEEDFDPIES